jgi:NADH-quinone oxidoreductase subunit J
MRDSPQQGPGRRGRARKPVHNWNGDAPSVEARAGMFYPPLLWNVRRARFGGGVFALLPGGQRFGSDVGAARHPRVSQRAHGVNLILMYLLCAVGAMGIAMALPRRKANPQIFGGLIAATAGGLGILLLGITTVHQTGVSSLPNIYFYIFAFVALAAALRVITHQKPVYAALYFILTIIASAGLFLILSAEFMAFALIIVYAGAILITYLFVIMLATQSPDENDQEVLAGYDLESREPILAVIAGFVLLATLLTLGFRGVDVLPAPASGTLAASNALMSEMPQKVEAALKIAQPELGKFTIAKFDSGAFKIDPVARTVGLVLADKTEQTVAWPDDLQVKNIEYVGFNLLRDHPGTIEIAGVILLMAMLGAVVLSRKQVQMDEDAKARAVRAMQAEAADQTESLGVLAPGAGGVADAGAEKASEAAAMAGGAR